MKLWAVVPSRDRRDMLFNLVAQLLVDDVEVVVVDNGYDPPLDESPNPRVHIRRVDQTPPNLSYLWNYGLGWARAHHNFEKQGDYVVAVLNDDLVLPERFVSQLAHAIELTGAAAAYPDQHGVATYGTNNARIIHKIPGPISLFARMCGYAFALRGSAKITADETLKWWYGDDDIDWTARQCGGSVLVGGLKVEHLCPNQTTVGVLAEQAGRDRQTFIDKWGRAPW